MISPTQSTLFLDLVLRCLGGKYYSIIKLVISLFVENITHNLTQLCLISFENTTQSLYTYLCLDLCKECDTLSEFSH